MRRFISIVTVMLLLLCSRTCIVSADYSTTGAVLQQTVVQTLEHISRLKQAIETYKILQDQLSDTKGILNLATEAALGIDGVEFISDFKNIVVETGDLIQSIDDLVDTDSDVFGQWKDAFGSLEDWMEGAEDLFESIDASDRINSNGYLIADSYQDLYERNSINAKRFIENAKLVNEKGAMKQVAEEMGHLIEMENQVVYLLSQLLKSQSMEFSNENLKRKEEVLQFEQEQEGVRRFMGLVETSTFDM